MHEHNFDEDLSNEIEAVSINARARGFGTSEKIIYQTKYTTIVAYAFHIPRTDGTIHHFDLKITKYKRKKTTESWNLSLDTPNFFLEEEFKTIKLDDGDGKAVKILTEFLNSQFEALGQKIEKKKVIIDSPEDIDLNLIRNLSTEKLQNINSLVSIKSLENIYLIWVSNRNNSNEEFWQKSFQNNPWILSQIFSCHFIQIGTKFYCGGKEDDDRGGVKGDLLYKNFITGNLAFIEIKTPETKIIGSIYRGNSDGKKNVIYSMSDEITGGVNQVLNQRKVYLSEHGDNNGKFLDNAKCILIIGNLENLCEDEKKSYELYRYSMKDVDIISFDELFQRIKSFLEYLKHDTLKPHAVL